MTLNTGSKLFVFVFMSLYLCPPGDNWRKEVVENEEELEGKRKRAANVDKVPKFF